MNEEKKTEDIGQLVVQSIWKEGERGDVRKEDDRIKT